ncbi:gag/pol protein [Cucumis melo var. makuwa]|uniref:Gag/pol protein n=1 Tax=Cucumis melo var. makuwa TaxID=1194695 RepID=A0A5A7VIJ9_CUCMM|nr:gag/pol protein [Cucumis melo var. makuwa]TYK26032.1 gag/pol protein [Cucumis melo var. makuwa]
MAKVIMDSFRELFGQPSWSFRHETNKHISTKRMKDGTSVREHVLDMMLHFNIIESGLSGYADYSYTPIIYEANQNLTMSKGKEVKANIATTEKELLGGSSSKTKVQSLQMKMKGKGKAPKNSKGKKFVKGTCYHCNQNGHWLRKLPKVPY